MKLFSITVAFAVLAMSLVKADLKGDLEKLNKVCAEQSKATSEELNAFFGKGMREEDVTDAVKCHVKCIMEQNGHYKDGSVDQEHVLKTLDAIPSLQDHMKDITAALEDCKNEKGTDECDTAFKITACFNNTEAGKLALAAY
ncbi:general odorant-binding protein 56h-like precursor [Stomoxys calcitrans]|uniref:Putative odorant binding protein n=1 Tax=Stomoxys calcitrans TaxID=35570 RepID=D2D0C7_STOCA|nr:general odorant-binding protein 56h-like precursor [Stomoxys calcitrans]ACO83217.1 putative odorant binding protein [Stomoxys calcitrans]